MVVLEQQRVVAMSASARAAGVQLGMSLGGVQIRAPHALLRQRDTYQEAARSHAAAMACLQFSPQVCQLDERNLLIYIGASLRLFGGVRRLRQRILHCIAQLGLQAQWGLAITSGGAYLLARQEAKSFPYCSRSAFKFSKLQRHLNQLPIHLLPTATAYNDYLHSVGCTHLAKLRQLPRASLQRRCGAALLNELDVAYGDTTTLYTWLSVPAQFSAKIELPDRLENAGALFYFARILILQLTGWLTQQQLALHCFEIDLEHERGKQAISPTQLKIRLAHPNWRESHLSRLVQERLAHLNLSAPVILLRLHVSETAPMQVPSGDLFPEPGASQEEQSELLELLIARLGADHVLRPQIQADHRPEFANLWCSAQIAHQREKVKKTNPLTATPTVYRPTWLLPQPQLLETRQHRPYYRTPLRLISPAERIEAAWWHSHPVTRDYFIAESSDHLRYWIFRERITSGQDAGEATQWYLHGIFG